MCRALRRLRRAAVAKAPGRRQMAVGSSRSARVRWSLVPRPGRQPVEGCSPVI